MNRKEVFGRTEMFFGEDGMARLERSRVAVFGVGGVGGYVVEALVRSGVGAIDVIDNDDVSVSNINRQIIATCDTVGRSKVDVARERILSINPDCKVTAHKLFYLPETAESFDFSQYDYIVDAVDTVTAKLDIIERATALGVPVISSMGAGNKLDPTKLCVCDIYKTSVCPLARVMRRELKKRGVKRLKVVYSTEEAVTLSDGAKSVTDGNKRSVPASNAFVPPVAGLIIAGEVVKELAYGKKNDA